MKIIKYTLNDQVLFDPEMGTLSRCQTPDEPVTIPNAAKRLLLLMIQHHGEVLCREVFFKKVWDDYGLISSHNNLNQCVSRLRRVVDQLGIDEEVITTVPKVGFMLRQEISIEEIEDSSSNLSAHEKEPEDGQITLGSPASLAIKQHRTWRDFTINKLFLYLFIITVFFSFCYWFYAYKSPQSVEEHYLGQVNSCKVFLVSRSSSILIKEGMDIMDYAHMNQYQCDPDEYLLLMTNDMALSYVTEVSRIFFMRCRRIYERKVEICRELREQDTMEKREYS